MTSPGDDLLRAAKACKQKAVLVAPFIKKNALGRILDEIDKGVHVVVVARWIPDEIVAGVCDLEIFDVLEARGAAELRVHQLLHAKLYRFDDTVYFGSANLTWRACGWASPSNIEILRPSPVDDKGLQEFEADLLAASICVDQKYRDAILAEVQRIRASAPRLNNVFEDDEAVLRRDWLPTCRVPDKLWMAYSDADGASRRMVESAFDAARADIKSLAIEPGFPQDHFLRRVVATLEGMPLIKEVDKQARSGKGLSDDRAISLIEAEVELNEHGPTAKERWEILREWMMFFFPNRYMREQATEVFRAGRVMA